MSIQRYRIGPGLQAALLANYLPSGATLSGFGTQFVDINLTDDLEKADLDEFMTALAGDATFEETTPMTAVETAACPTGYPNGARLAWGSNATTTIAPGKARSDDDTFDLVWAGTLTANITVSGVNGLDTGVEAANTLYSQWVIGDSTGVNPVATLYSVSATAPTLPAGYDKKWRAGWALNGDGGASTNFFNFLQVGNGRTRRIWYDVSSASTAMRVLTNGAAAVFAPVDLSAFVPSTSENVLLIAQFETGAAGNANDDLEVRPDGFSFSVGGGPTKLGPGFTSDVKSDFPLEVGCPGRIIEYAVDDAVNNQATINVVGYDDEL